MEVEVSNEADVEVTRNPPPVLGLGPAAAAAAASPLTPFSPICPSRPMLPFPFPPAAHKYFVPLTLATLAINSAASDHRRRAKSHLADSGINQKYGKNKNAVNEVVNCKDRQ